jgi:hypothetical protein
MLHKNTLINCKNHLNLLKHSYFKGINENNDFFKNQNALKNVSNYTVTAHHKSM